MTDFDKLAQELLAKSKAETKAPLQSRSLIDYTGEFIKSGISSAGPEMIGLEPLEGVRQFRQANPGAGLASELAGSVVPYLGWFTATKKIKRLDDLIEGIGDAKKSPLLTGAAREVVRFAPFEGARIAGAAGAGGDVGETAFEAAVNIGLGGAVGAALGGLRAAGPRLDDLDKIVPGIDLSAPAPLQLRQLREGMKGLEGDTLDMARQRANALEKAVRLERTSGPYVGALEGNRDGEALGKLFEPSPFSRQLLESQTGFKTRAEYKKLLSDAAIPEDADGFWQFPRALRIGSSRKAQATQSSITGALQPVEPGWWMGREADDGLFVMAKKLQGEATKGAKGDEWLIFKTDSPQKFVPARAGWADTQIARMKWQPEAVAPKIGAEVWDELGQLREVMPFRNYREMVGPEGRIRGLAGKIVGATGLDKLKGTSVDYMSDRLVKVAKEYLAPTMFQFGKSPRAKWLYSLARMTFDKGAGKAEAMLFGEQTLQGGKGLMYDILVGTKGNGYKGGTSIKQLVDDLSDEDLYHVWRAWNGQWDQKAVREALVQNEFTEKAAGFIDRLRTLDEELVGELSATEKAAGNSGFVPLPNHLMISRTWQGSWRVPIRNEADELVFMASGKTRDAALKEADQILKEAEKEGKFWSYRDGHLADRTTDLDVVGPLHVGSSDFSLAAAIRDRTIRDARKPNFTKERHNIPGYTGYAAPWDKKELMDILSAHIGQAHKYQADLAFTTQMESELAKLAAENPAIFQQLRARIDDLRGVQGPLGKWINQQVDKVLAPALGANSATKIVRAMNTFEMNMRLGMGNLAFPLLNAMTFMQTTLPQVAFVMSAPAERLGKYYSWFPVAGADARPKGGAGVLDTIKLGYQSFRELRAPDQLLRNHFDRGAAEGVWDPRFVEEYVGEKSNLRAKLKGSLESPEGFVDFVKNVSEFLPGQTEKFARGHTFVLGHILGRDFLRLGGDDLYRFAKEFTNNTMFLYSTADRPRLMSGPLGSLFGMFKNWQMHYLGWMMEYAGTGLMNGNWKPMLWSVGGTGTLAGLGGLPIYGAADAFSKWTTNESLVKNVYDMFGPGERGTNPSAADSVFFGLPAFFNVSLQGSAASPGADPARDASLLFSFVHWDRMKAIGKFAGTAVDTWAATGNHPIDSQLVREQFVKAFAPKSIARTSQVLAGDYINSLNTGNPLIRGLTPGERMLFAAGFNPRYIERSFMVASELWQNQTKMKEKVQTYGRLWQESIESRDYDEAQELLKSAVAEQVPIDSVIRSGQTRLEKSRADMMSREFDPVSVWKMQGVIGR